MVALGLVGKQSNNILVFRAVASVGWAYNDDISLNAGRIVESIARA